MNREARQRFQALAKQLSYILGHAPDEFGLVLEPGGWIPLRTLVQALHEEDAWKGITVSRIIDLGWQLEDCPFEFEGERIRFKSGAAGEQMPPEREQTPPPVILYLAVRRRFYPVLCEKGYEDPPSGEIILARDKGMATRIGARRDPQPVLVEVHTKKAEELGSRFFSYGQNLFVTQYLPAEGLAGPPLRLFQDTEKKSLSSKTKKQAPPRSSSENGASHAWNPATDRLMVRDDPEAKSILKRERDKKKIGWKDALRKEKRKG